MIRSEFEVVLQEKLHVDTLSRQAQSSLDEEPPHPAEDSLRLSAGGGHAQVFTDEPGQGWVLLLSGFPPLKSIFVLCQNRLISVPDVF